ncbi:ATP-binding cassette domain-containing protein [Novosphingobium taihuense]|uniref:Molybdate transport system ATP-binding protein n=1 Tax=Novosphingobium taihuense TaxID=260085 RepID=A0A7W7AE81_9SPHN|nr:ATP-binding cassette domain-containing protein [Novosphingobium taihuense]MBB4614699.1 molybdate transport system ATP-binding protein [Novosphingobium taihuense]TWH86059.1 molybdate transport system ATP-binding protein [Novosphingobium taihuense]
MSFEISVSRRLGDTLVQCAFVADAGLTALFGPSGAGKTSVLNMVAGLLKPDEGRIVVAGEVLFDSTSGTDISVQARRAGYVFQDGRLFPHMRVRDNLLFGSSDDGLMSLADAAEFLGIGHLLDRWPRTLSGGEAQRVAIGRAMLSNPRFLLMDEPLAALDRARREEVMRTIERLRDELGLPILYVSHDRAEVKRLAGHIVEI